MANAGRGAAYLAAAALFAMPVVTLLLIALALWIREASGISFALSCLISALIGAAVGLICGLIAMNYLKAKNLRPTSHFNKFGVTLPRPRTSENESTQFLDNLNDAVRENPVAAGLIGMVWPGWSSVSLERLSDRRRERSAPPKTDRCGCRYRN